MTNDDEILGAELASRVSRLPREIEPPGDLWPGIAARLTREDASLAALVRRLEPEVAPDWDLWPPIAARLERRVGTGIPRRSSLVPVWFATAASVAAITVVAAIASLMFVTTERALAPAGDDVVAQAVDSIQAELAKVQSDRLVIEESLRRDADNLTLHALWRYAYQTELDLAGKAEGLVDSYQGV